MLNRSETPPDVNQIRDKRHKSVLKKHNKYLNAIHVQANKDLPETDMVRKRN